MRIAGSHTRRTDLSVLRWLTTIFARGDYTARPRSAKAPPIGKIPNYLLDADKIANLSVLFSSPLTSLSEARTALWEHLKYMPGVEPFAFEFKGRTGETPASASRQAVDQSDIMVLLIGEEVGTTDTATGETYSQIEYEAMVDSQWENSGRPRVLVYVTSNLKRSLSQWEREAMDNYGYFEWEDPDQLALRATVDISSSLIVERREQAAALAEALEIKRRLHEDAESRHTLAVAGIEHKAQAIGILEKSLEAADRSVTRLMEQVDPGRIYSWRLPVWTLACLLIGVATGFMLAERTPVSRLGEISVVSSDLKNASKAVERIADQYEVLPHFVRAKSLLARQLNPSFDCGIKDRLDYVVQDVPDAWFSRRDACEGFGALVIRINREVSPCEIQALHPDQTIALAKHLSSDKVRLDAVRVVGHASTEPIRNTCQPSQRLVACAPRGSAADLVINSNDKLATARAILFSCDLEEALRTLDVAVPRVEPTGLGALMAARGGVGDTQHRKVDIEVYASAIQ